MMKTAQVHGNAFLYNIMQEKQYKTSCLLHNNWDQTGFIHSDPADTSTERTPGEYVLNRL